MSNEKQVRWDHLRKIQHEKVLEKIETSQSQFSDEEESILLTTPELVSLYIKKYRLNPDNQLLLLQTPRLVKEYYDRYGIDIVILTKIISKYGNLK
jgi:hypothetical protein